MSGLWLPDGVDPTKIDVEVDDTSTDPRVRRMEGFTNHGNFHFDVPFITPIADNLWHGGCTTGLVLPDEIVHVVSLYPWEQYTVHQHIRSVLSVVMYDSLEQGVDQIDGIAAWVNTCRADGPTLVHCQAGLNRSSLVVARALMFSDGLTGDQAVELLREKRSPAVLCNRAFEQHIRSSDLAESA